MSNSSLAKVKIISPSRTSPRNHAIDTITIHCMAGQLSAETCGNLFSRSSTQASSNYGVGPDGKIGLYVEEKDRSWCTSNYANDMRAVTIEVASDSTHPYAVTAAAYNATIELVADICKRNGIKKLVWSTDKTARVNHKNGANMTVHRDYANKACPGDYLYSRMGDIASKVNAKLGGTTTPTTPAQPAKAAYKVQVGAYSKKANATAQMNKLKKAGYDAFIVQEGNLFKVQVGSFSNKANADAMVAKLKKAGYTAIVSGGSAQPATPKNPYSEPVSQYVGVGTTGNGAKWVQWELNRHGYKLQVDGIIGTQSLAAIRDFQRKKGLSVDGIVGPATRAALKK